MLALEVVHETARIIGLGMVNALHLFDPAMIIVGGSVSLMGDVLLNPVRETIERHAMPPYRGRPLVPAKLGDDCSCSAQLRLLYKRSQMVETNTRRARRFTKNTRRFRNSWSSFLFVFFVFKSIFSVE